MDLNELYASHPLNRATILARLARQGIDPRALTEWHLAIDLETEITDQNHSGGVGAVLDIASAAGVTQTSIVADIGAGLAGSARVLAAAVGCRVVAVERDRRRHDDAAALTAAVHLQDKVVTIHADALAGTYDMRGGIDVLWGQSAWVHFSEPEAFLQLWLPALTPAGRVAMADSFLTRAPDTEAETELLATLERCWGAHLTTVERWLAALTQAGLRTIDRTDRSSELLRFLRRLQVVSDRWPVGMRTELEANGWRYAIAALEQGLIRSEQVVASR